MRLLLYTDQSAIRHDTGWGHPERPARIQAVLDGVETSGAVVDHRSPGRVGMSALEAVHDPAYIRAIERFCATGGGHLDPDTVVNGDSWDAALRSAGAGIDAVAALREDEADVAFVVMRPPGHHALAARAMGFCLFNNVAVTARALASAGDRVAIVDWDVHHGNGTQEVFYGDDAVLYVSLHEFPAYPGTGWVEEIGSRAGTGFTLNLPFPSGTGGAVYRSAFSRVVLPVIEQFDPDWVLVSAGYDAHEADPLADLRLVASDYEAMSRSLAAVTPARRMVFFLEGGYDLAALTKSARSTVRGAMSPDRTAAAEFARGAGPAWRILDLAIETVAPYWTVH